jgi:hypothetical protein
VPTSRRTGTTSRTTNGIETNMVASTIPGTEKRIFKPWWERPPSQPPRPYSRTSPRPTITGEIASGRSTTAFSSPRPRQRPRTSSSARMTPTIVLTGTAIAAISSVSTSAWTASCVVTACHACANPCSKAR